ncbi:hypothetical protein [Rhodobacter ferrooxidans]|uniref:Secreted protein n=1 Tax=Rhodobacter ferrooxidans TaxID=371731 RepID=C8S2N8_9RHOB|nr:hypothetical protein [Rhodobacter sp. SW2]EEW24714.1 hypothetical protein Rsw2DRAFT_2316 [Rhodobacter sp. SW2]
MLRIVFLAVALALCGAAPILADTDGADGLALEQTMPEGGDLTQTNASATPHSAQQCLGNGGRPIVAAEGSGNCAGGIFCATATVGKRLKLTCIVPAAAD